MNKEIKQEWVTALRSGDYEQGTGLLRTSDNKFCCLGVLADVVGVGTWQLNAAAEYATSHYIPDFTTDRVLTDKFLDSIDLERENCIALMKLNDVYNKDFNEIADYIEEHLW